MQDSDSKPNKLDEESHDEICDDKGNGSQKDIKSDRIETPHAGDGGEVKPA